MYAFFLYSNMLSYITHNAHFLVSLHIHVIICKEKKQNKNYANFKVKHTCIYKHNITLLYIYTVYEREREREKEENKKQFRALKSLE
jgi:hypothetical protein